MDNRNQSTRVWWWGGFVVFLGLLTWGIVALQRSGPTVAAGDLPAPVTDADWITGNPQATVTLVEYADFQCPACAAYHGLLKQLLQEEGTKFRFVYRNFPLRSIHRNADNSARAAEAAGIQGKFWNMYDLLLEHQSEWSSLADPTDTFVGYAQQIGLNLDAFRSDLKSQAVLDQINADLAGANRARLNATPTFFLNGKQIPGPQSYEAFRTLITTAAQ